MAETRPFNCSSFSLMRLANREVISDSFRSYRQLPGLTTLYQTNILFSTHYDIKKNGIVVVLLMNSNILSGESVSIFFNLLYIFFIIFNLTYSQKQPKPEPNLNVVNFFTLRFGYFQPPLPPRCNVIQGELFPLFPI